MSQLEHGLTNAVHVTAARLRFLLNVKSLGVGGGPRRQTLAAPSAGRNSLKWIKQLFGPQGQGSSVDLESTSFEDHPEDRNPLSFPRLAAVMEEIRTNPSRCRMLCLEQIRETPDFDFPYIWASNITNVDGHRAEAIDLLSRGLLLAKRVSGILSKLGERYLEAAEPRLIVLAFGRAILAERPLRSNHTPYLYFSLICASTDYGNAARTLAATAQEIYPNIALTNEEAVSVVRLMQPVGATLQPLVREFIRKMLEAGCGV